MVKKIDVVGIKLDNIYDLVRFNLNTKSEHEGFVSYPIKSGYRLGMYYLSFIRKFPISFIYVDRDSKPRDLFHYYVDGREHVIEGEYRNLSVGMVHIPVAFLNVDPHRYVSVDRLNIGWKVFEVDSLRSLLVLAHQAYFEYAEIPYMWFDVRKKIYYINIYYAGEKRLLNIIYHLKYDEYVGPYIFVEDDFSGFSSTDIIKDLTKKHFLVVRVIESPYSEIITGV
jgi:hypothetical protein